MNYTRKFFLFCEKDFSTGQLFSQPEFERVVKEISILVSFLTLNLIIVNRLNKRPILGADLPFPPEEAVFTLACHPNSGGGVYDKKSTLSVRQNHELHPIVRLENAFRIVVPS